MFFSFEAPKKIDPRPWLQIEQQGRMGSCAGHAGTSVSEYINWVDTGGGIVQLSRMFCYIAGQQESGISGDQGATITGVIQALKKMGICLEETFPYPSSYSDRLSPEAVSEAAQHKILQHSVLKSYDEVFQYLAAGLGAVEIGIPWTSSLANNRDGVIEAAAGQNYGGHALAIIGYTERKWPIMANSHGTGWGKNGFAEIHPRLFDEWGRDSYSELIGISDLQEYGVRELSFLENVRW